MSVYLQVRSRFYVITHLVKPGVGRPSSWSLQPWKKSKKASQSVDTEKLLSAVYATAIAKYVVKRGRITVPPEQVLMESDMLPSKPEGWTYSEPPSDSSAKEADILPRTLSAEDWTWDAIEAERLKGLKIAEHFAAMDGMHGFFDGGKDGALGEFADLLI